MNSAVIAAIIAAIASVVTLIGTMITQRNSRRGTSEDVDRTLKAQGEQLNTTLEEQRKQLDTTLEEQRKQLDRTLDEQRTRTLNERFATAAGQLGSDKPAIRLAGMYAMAGLADDWEKNRQTIVNVICAYLRMPFSATDPAGKPEPKATEDAGEPAAETETSTDGIGGTWQQERQVRLTAQRVLTEHLREDQSSTDPPSPHPRE